ncbi:MAG: M28 family peptidase [Deltaproteobacteria bacterium]|nr:M28 family peptidase [Deltaproteobacteria bacterium]MBW2396183.1 M28 family peptidase [Deltaproteobacteria bacterium]
MLERLVGDGVPHPAGSPAATRVRERLIRELVQMGYSPVVRKGFACSAFGTCAEVQNVLARLPGSHADTAVLLASHYDSHPAGPGAADDGTGVVVLLEIARALRLDPRPRNDVIFLFDEGEEQGLIGAQVFAESDPWAADVAVVVNVEARGTGGPSAMFETSDGNANLLALFSRVVPRTSGSSVFQDLYEFLPNDTDLTIFKRHGMAGLNFANAGNVEHYHTPVDDVAHANLATIQQHGDAILPLTRALAAAELPIPVSNNSAFFDAGGKGLIRWPLAWGVPFALLALLGVIGVLGDQIRRGALSVRQLSWGSATWLLGIALALTLGFGLTIALQGLDGSLAPWTAYPLPARIAFWVLGLTSPLVANNWLGRYAGPLGAFGGAALCWAILGLALTIPFPGAGFLLVFPLLAATLGISIGGLRRSEGDDTSIIIGSLCWIAVAGFFWLPMAFLIETMLGFRVGALVAASVAIAGSGLAALMVRAEKPKLNVLVVACVACISGASILQLALPSYTRDHPRHMSIMFHQDADAKTAQWIVSERQGPVPERMRAAGGLIGSELPLPTLPGWHIDRAAVGPAKSLPIPGPEAEILATRRVAEGREISLRLRSPRGAPTMELWLPPEAKPVSVAISGTNVPPNSERMLVYGKGWHRFAHRTVPAEGFDLVLVLPGDEPVSAVLIEQSFELPDTAADLLATRPDFAVPAHAGDTTVLTRRLEL